MKVYLWLVKKKKLYIQYMSSLAISSMEAFTGLSVTAREILRKLNQFSELGYSWDDRGAEPPSSDVINRAAAFLVTADEQGLPIYFTAPGPNGEVLLEYKKSNLSAEIYFEPLGTPEMILYTGPDQTYAGQLDMTKLIGHLK